MDKDTPIASDTPTEPSEDEDEFAYYHYRPQKQAWAILGVVFFVVGVAVLWVYQTGDRKTILSKKELEPKAQAQVTAAIGAPIDVPMAPPYAATAPPAGCTANNCALGGRTVADAPGPVAPAPIGGTGWDTPSPSAPGGPDVIAAMATPDQPTAAVSALCPRCGSRAMPLCHRCNSIMLPLGGPLFYCPQCGTVGTPPCPYCGSRMTADGPLRPQPPQVAQSILAGTMRLPPPAIAGPVAGQFVCPRCYASGLPNWTPDGRPTCPSCGATMSTQGRAAIARLR
jgi:hypothetical protein